MPRLFSYGTLQQDEVQLANFGRKLDGQKDLITGYEPSLLKITDPAISARLGRTHHDNISPTGDDWSNVQGTVFEVTDEDLAKADTFEQEFNYTRVKVTLASGTEAWVYVHQD
ncbi:MAG: gamma-glutamylcyclotransferase family protein [Vicinamibacterales bacterium]